MKKTIIHFLYTLAFIIFSININAQGLSLENLRDKNKSNIEFTNPKNQLGVVFNSHEGISLMYKRELKKDLFLRGEIDLPGFSFQDRSDEQGSFSYFLNLGASLGIEKHIPINRRFSFYYGAELGLNWYTQKFRRDGQSTSFGKNTSLNLSAIAGLQYRINNRISIFGEVNAGYEFNASNYNGNRYKYGRYNNSFSLGAMIKLGKK